MEKPRPLAILILAVVGIAVVHFACVFSMPEYRQWIREIGHRAGTIDTRDLQEAQYLRQLFDSIEGTKGKTTIGSTNDSDLSITFNVNATDRAAFKKSIEEVRKMMKADIKREPRPFLVKTRDYDFRLPE